MVQLVKNKLKNIFEYISNLPIGATIAVSAGTVFIFLSILSVLLSNNRLDKLAITSVLLIVWLGFISYILRLKIFNIVFSFILYVIFCGMSGIMTGSIVGSISPMYHSSAPQVIVAGMGMFFGARALGVNVKPWQKIVLSISVPSLFYFALVSIALLAGFKGIFVGWLILSAAGISFVVHIILMMITTLIKEILKNKKKAMSD